MKGICFMVALTLLVAGCGNRLGGAADIRMVIYQPAGFGHLPMPSRMPLRGKPMQITAQTDIAAIFNAVKRPDGKAQTREARNNRLALVAQNGSVIMLGITFPTVYGCDITREQSSKKLGPALPAARARARVVKLTPASPVRSVSYCDAGVKKQPAPAAIAKSQLLLKELFKRYSPLALKGNRRCEAREARDHTRHTPRFLTIKLAKPDSLEAIVATGDTEWPPDVYDTSARLERIEFDMITIFHESKGLARFVFTDSKSNECLFTDPVNSLRLVKEAQGRNPAVYGPDLFDEVVSALTKS